MITGLHHVTATVDDAQADLDFCIELLGMRLVKKTVNFDNHRVYHFYYGSETGDPGTIWTTFPYRGHRVPKGTHGAGQITATSFSVPAASLPFWKERLALAGITITEGVPRFGDAAIAFADPSGLVFELVGTDADRRTPWSKGMVDAASAIRGIHSVSLSLRSLTRTIELLTGLLDFTVVDEAAGRTRLGVNGGGPGKTVDLLHTPLATPGMNGLGTVHHVALATTSDDEQLRMRRELITWGLDVTPVMDRSYFHSIYFREPGGVLLEIATRAPGFAIDEEPSQLGRGLKLPPWEEPDRGKIEAGLEPVTYR